MSEVVIIHFLPLENYPPVMNLARFLSSKNHTQIPITVLSTHGYRKKNVFSARGIHIFRVASWTASMSSISRYWLYLKFNVYSLSKLLQLKPARVMYYETLSSFPAVVYKKLFARKAEIFIHYHEYTSKEEYKRGMFLSRLFHQMEQSIYGEAKWISHTNSERAELFKNDVSLSTSTVVHELPNYPPLSWIQKSAPTHFKGGRGRFVYVGAVSLQTMYVQEWVTFISRHPERFSLDIYSDNFSEDVLEYINELNAPNIRFKGSVEYDTLPEILRGYDTGLILYKGHIPNYIYNAPNKLFEYHACGLDTIFPFIMKGCLPFITQGTYPKIAALDFDRLNIDVVSQLLNRDGLQYQSSSFYYEKNLHRLTDELLKHV